ncbi:MAG: hypothetical protein HW378_4207 [Anaerolineales bacterium]|nr:hypothetical protein [Anaerolineales bacterium]
MPAEGGGDLPVGQREHLGQLGRQHAIGCFVVATVAGDEVAVQKDGALIVRVDDLEPLSEGGDAGK